MGRRQGIGGWEMFCRGSAPKKGPFYLVSLHKKGKSCLFGTFWAKG